MLLCGSAPINQIPSVPVSPSQVSQRSSLGLDSLPDVLQLWLRPPLLCVSRAAAGCVRVLARTWQVFSQAEDGHGGTECRGFYEGGVPVHCGSYLTTPGARRTSPSPHTHLLIRVFFLKLSRTFSVTTSGTLQQVKDILEPVP